MKWMVSKTRRAVACALVTLFGAGFVVQAAGPSGRPAASGSHRLTNATVVAVDTEAGTLTVRGGGIGKEQTFTIPADARRDIRALKRGDEVVLALSAAATGEEAVTRVERSPATKPSPRSTARGDDPLTATPAPVATRPLATPTSAPSPAAAGSAPSGERPATDVVGPFRDPRVNPHFDPRLNPHRDPRVIPGLTEPAPTPAPTTSPATGG
jgi:hypothetical protein